MDHSPALHVVVQATRMTGLAYGTNPFGGDGGRVFVGPDDQAGLTLELDSLEAASRLLSVVEDLVTALRVARHGEPLVVDEPAVLIREPGRTRRALGLVGRPS